MKIGILTLPLHTNYGGILQAYALQTVLERMGHCVTVIGINQYPLPQKHFYYIIYYLKRIIKKIFIDHHIKINNNKYLEECLPIVCQHTWRFIREHINECKYNDVSQIKEDCYDAFVVGSDQIWRPKFFPHIENAYLDFTEGWKIKRISYAASLGASTWEYTKDQTANCKALIKNFDAISVREYDAVKLIQEYFDIDATHVVDPTMLLKVEDYYQLFEQKADSRILNYILDNTDDKRKILENIEVLENSKSYKINSKFEDYDAPIEERIQFPVEEWLANIAASKLVITDSFHACVFSILFHRPFVVMANHERGLSRINSLLRQLDLKDRIIFNIDDYKKMNNIDWEQVDSILTDLQQKSFDFINIHLNE